MESHTGPSRPPNPDEINRQAQLDRLKTFLATAPSRWSSQSSAQGQQQQNHHHHQQQQQSAAQAQYSLSSSQNGSHLPTLPTSHPALNRFLLPSGEYVSCVLWAGLYHITGTDIVRALVFRFEAFGRPVINMKKFEEGVFSDLRNLKPGTDACLEEPKSPFLDLLFKYQCIRTQKKQKVFYWFSVPHDRLFLDALERDLKREKMGQESTTVPRGEPGLSFTYDPKRTLYEQFLKPNNAAGGGGRALLCGNANEDDNGDDDDDDDELPSPGDRGMNTRNISVESPADIMFRRIKKRNNMNSVKVEETDSSSASASQQHQQNTEGNASFGNKETFLMFSLPGGSPGYKQRRKKPSGSGASAAAAAENSRRRSTLASGVVSRRGSVLANESSRRGSMIAPLSGAESPVALSSHPSLSRYQSNPTAGSAFQPPQSSGSSSRPGSQHQQHPGQQLSNFGLSTNHGAQDLERDGYMSRQQQQQQLHHSPQQMSIHELEAERDGRPSTGSSTHTTTFICPLGSCQRPFPRKDLLQKHMPTHPAGALLQPRWRERREGSVRDGEDGGSGSGSGGLRLPCEGCLKVFSHAENLRLHMASCMGRSSRGNTANSGGADEQHMCTSEMENAGVVPMDASYDDDVVTGYAHAHGGNPTLNLDLAYTHRDIGSSHGHPAADAIHGHPPNSAGSTAQGQYASAETSPYVETPEGGGLAQWVNVSPVHTRTMHHIPEHQDQHSAHLQHHQEHQQAHQYHPLAGIPVLSHHLSWQNLGPGGAGSDMASPPGSAHSAQSVFGAQQLQQTLHPRYRSPESAAYGYAHPSSAPSQKVAFDQSSLYPPSYQHAPRAGAGAGAAMTGVSLRRYRSATPSMTGNGGGGLRAEYHPAHQQHHADSRPASSAGGESNYDYGSVVVNPAAAAAAAAHGHPFAYSVDSGDGRLSYVPPGSAHGVGVVPIGAGGPGSDHSSPQSYGNVAMVNGEYIESNSQYDGSNGSPGSVGHGGATMIPMPEPRIMVAMPPPPRGHIHSLSSEIATQQMQQYVDLDGLAEDNDVPPPVSASAPPSFHGHVRYPQQQPQQQQQSRYHDESHDGVPRYLHAEQQAAYHSSSSEGGHEEMYPYRFQQQAAMHTHQPEHPQPPYPSRYYHEQRVAL